MSTSPAALRRLRRLVEAAQRERRSLAIADVIDLAAKVGISGRIAIDLSAAEYLGHPLVVVAPPTLSISDIGQLTAREREVARMLADQLSNVDIANRLGISVGTVKHHVHSILEKTGTTGRHRFAAEVRNLSSDPLTP